MEEVRTHMRQFIHDISGTKRSTCCAAGGRGRWRTRRRLQSAPWRCESCATSSSTSSATAGAPPAGNRCLCAASHRLVASQPALLFGRSGKLNQHSPVRHSFGWFLSEDLVPFEENLEKLSRQKAKNAVRAHIPLTRRAEVVWRMPRGAGNSVLRICKWSTAGG